MILYYIQYLTIYYDIPYYKLYYILHNDAYFADHENLSLQLILSVVIFQVSSWKGCLTATYLYLLPYYEL